MTVVGVGEPTLGSGVILGVSVGGMAEEYFVPLIFVYILNAKSAIRRQINEGIRSGSLFFRGNIFLLIIIHNNEA
jgi:hypothetical protein